MKIRKVRHHGSRRFVENDDYCELRGDLVKRIRNVLAFLVAASNIENLGAPPGWRAHQPAGDRAGTWSIPVSGNWRITFTVGRGEIANPDLEDNR